MTIDTRVSGGGAPSSAGVYDVHEGFHRHPDAFCEAYCVWLEAHGIDRHDTYRTEHHIVDAPLVRVFQYAKDESGRRYYDEAADDTAKRDPFDVLIRITPPSPEDYR